MDHMKITAHIFFSVANYSWTFKHNKYILGSVNTCYFHYLNKMNGYNAQQPKKEGSYRKVV